MYGPDQFEANKSLLLLAGLSGILQLLLRVVRGHDHQLDFVLRGQAIEFISPALARELLLFRLVVEALEHQILRAHINNPGK